MLMRLALAILSVVGSLTLARADGLTSAGTAAQGLCYAAGISGPRVPCVLQEQAWTRVLRPTDPIDGATVGGTAISAILGSKAPLASPTFTGTVTAPAFSGAASAMTTRATGALIDRTLAARAGEVVNAADYFVCDGTSDIRAGLVAAIAAAVPRPLYIPPQLGNCLLSSGVSLKSRLVVYARRGTVTLAPSAANTSGTVLLSGVVVDNVRIEGLGFDGGGQDFSNPSSLVVLYRVGKVVIDQTDFANSRGSAVLVSNANDTGVTNSTFANIGNHWRSTGSKDDRFAGVTICCNDVAGQSYGNNNYVRGNKFTDIGLDAISSSYQTNFSADQNKCVWTYKQSAVLSAPDYPACVYEEYSNGFTAIGNTSIMSPGNSYDLKNTTRFTLAGNSADKAGQAGIAVSGSVGTISGNTLTNGVQWTASVQKGGISIFDGQNVSVSGNVATDTQTTKTQLYGVWGQTGFNRTGAIIDQSNVLSGNATGPLGGGITAYGVQ